MASSRWITRPTPSPSARVRLFAFPYAGATARAFAPLAQVLGARVEVCVVEYPGRGTRWGEPLLRSVDALVSGVLVELRPLLDRPFALFGYSLGGTVAFEVARALRRENGPNPAALLIASRHAAHLVDRRPPTWNLPTPRLMEELRALGGAPAEVLAQADLMELFLPIVRADLQAAQTYSYRDEPPLDVPITVFAGTKDPIDPPPEVDAWRAQTTGAFTAHVLPGGHFFMNDAQSDFIAALKEAIV